MINTRRKPLNDAIGTFKIFESKSDAKLKNKILNTCFFAQNCRCLFGD